MEDALEKIKDDLEAPLLLKKAEKKPKIIPITATHFTVVTTPGVSPEMHDQQEDRFR